MLLTNRSKSVLAQSSCRHERSFLDRAPPLKAPHPASSPPGSPETSRSDSCCQSRFAEFLPKLSKTVSGKLVLILIGVLTCLQVVVGVQMADVNVVDRVAHDGGGVMV